MLSMLARLMRDSWRPNCVLTALTSMRVASEPSRRTLTPANVVSNPPRLFRPNPPVVTEPGTSASKAVKSRPLRGRLETDLESIEAPKSLD